MAQPPSGVMDFVRAVASTLQTRTPPTNVPSDRVLAANFDSSMPGFAAFRDEVEALVAATNVGSTIELVTNEGDEQKQHSLHWTGYCGARR